MTQAHLVFIIYHRAQPRLLRSASTCDGDLIADRAVITAFQDPIDLSDGMCDLVLLRDVSEGVLLPQPARTSPLPGPSRAIRMKMPLLLGPGPTLIAKRPSAMSSTPFPTHTSPILSPRSDPSRMPRSPFPDMRSTPPRSAGDVTPARTRV